MYRAYGLVVKSSAVISRARAQGRKGLGLRV